MFAGTAASERVAPSAASAKCPSSFGSGRIRLQQPSQPMPLYRAQIISFGASAMPTITGISPLSITESPQLMGPRRVVIDVR